MTFTKCQNEITKLENMANIKLAMFLKDIFKMEVNSESLAIIHVAADSVHKFLLIADHSAKENRFHHRKNHATRCSEPHIYKRELQRSVSSFLIRHREDNSGKFRLK